jgi:hypothetical protein
VFDAAVASLNAERWNAMPAFVDPVSLRSFSAELITRVTPPSGSRSLTAEEYLAHDPNMPRSVAEYHVAQAATRDDAHARLAREFPEVASLTALSALTPEEIFVKWLQGKSMRQQFEQLVAAGQIAGDVAASRASLPFTTAYDYRVLGVVEDGDRVAHVLYRRNMAETTTWVGPSGMVS